MELKGWFGSRPRWRIAPLLTLTMVLVITGFTSAITVLDIRRTNAIFREELENRGVLLAEQLNDLLAEPLLSNNEEEIDRIAAIVSSQPSVSYLQIFTPEGRLLVDTSVSPYPVEGVVNDLGRSALEGSRSLVTSNDGVISVAKAVKIGNSQPVGGVWIGLSSSVLQAQIKGILVEHIWQGVVLAVIGIGISHLIAQYFVRPLRRLTTATEDMALGRLDTRVTGVEGGELGELAHSFNRMALELQANVRALEDSRHRIVVAQEGVRREIAAHLHGRVQGNLLILKSRLQELVEGASSLPEMAQPLQEIVNHLERIIQQELSDLSRRLYPSILRRGLVPALQSLGDQFEAALTIKMELEEHLVSQEKADRNVFPEPVRLAAYRIAEETLTNVVKHAKASEVVIQLVQPLEGELCISLRDNGQGFDEESASSGLGLSAMNDYAGAVGGVCFLRSVPGEGTSVTATLPIATLDTEHQRRAFALV